MKPRTHERHGALLRAAPAGSRRRELRERSKAIYDARQRIGSDAEVRQVRERARRALDSLPDSGLWSDAHRATLDQVDRDLEWLDRRAAELGGICLTCGCVLAPSAPDPYCSRACRPSYEARARAQYRRRRS